MTKIIDSDFHIFSPAREEKLSNFDYFKKLPKRQAYEALGALIKVIHDLELQEVADNYRKTDLGVGAYDLALNTFFGHALIVEREDGTKEEAFHDYWMSCQECGEEVENEQHCSIEQEDGEELMVCPDCFCSSIRGEEE